MKILIFFMIFSFSSFVYAQEEHIEEQEKEKIESEKEAIAMEVGSFSDLFRSQSKNAYKGVIFANILSVDERFIFVRPKEKEFSRMYIYLDSQTLFTKMIKGKRKKAKRDELLEGQRVAVRVIIKEGIILGDEIFLVEGEFDHPSRYRKRVVFASPKTGEKGGAKEEKKSGGGH